VVVGRWRRSGSRIPEHLRREARLELTRFSIPTVNWLQYPDGGALTGADPEPRWPLELVLDGAAGAGFVAVGLDHYTLRGCLVDDLGSMLRDRGLACSDLGVLPVGRDDLRSVAESLAHVALATGAPTCIAAFFAPLDRTEAVRVLDACAGILAPAGVRIALEFVSYGGLTRLTDAVALCDAVGWERCGLLLDTWHFFRSGAEWPLLRSLSGDQIALVHVNDGAEHVGDDLVWEGRFARLPVGAGTFPLTEFAHSLDAAGYRGILSTEVLSDAVRTELPEKGARVLLSALRDSWEAHD
jgi:sugar phosphate isomerase/epimerase